MPWNKVRKLYSDNENTKDLSISITYFGISNIKSDCLKTIKAINKSCIDYANKK